MKKTAPIWSRKRLGRHGCRIWLAKTWINFFDGRETKKKKFFHSNKNIKSFDSKKKNDEKIFVGVFPSSYVIRFINFHSMMIESKSNYPFILMYTDWSDKKVHIGGVSWIYIQKKKTFYLIVLVSKASKDLFSIMREIYSAKYSMVLKNLIKKIIK